MRLSMVTSWAELIASILATPLVAFYLFILVSSSLNRSVKVLLSMHGLNLFMLTTFQIVVAVSRISNPAEWRVIDVISNLPLFLHQIAYSSCTLSMLLITIERTIMALKPGLYGDSNASIRKIIVISLFSEIFYAIPSALLLQDGPALNGQKLYSTSETGQKLSLLLFTIFDCSSLTVKKVICLTRVLIPICCLSLVTRFVSIALAYLAYSDESKLDLYFSIIRFLCTGAAITEALMLLSRQPLLRKRMRRLLGLPSVDAWKLEDHACPSVTATYFDAFKRDLNKKK